MEDGTKPVVGVNLLREAAEQHTEEVQAFALREGAADEQIERLRRVRATRDDHSVKEALTALREGAAAGRNTIPLLIDAVRAYASIGEMCGVLKEVWGEHS